MATTKKPAAKKSLKKPAPKPSSTTKSSSSASKKTTSSSSPVARPKPAVKSKSPAPVVVPDVEISPPVDKTGKWTYRCNDELVTEDTFNSIMKDHEAWVIEQANAAKAADLPEKKTRKKK